ncbi:hypothetical protein PFISCL1PPCAC_26126 [Pristionchus fissidentatus]|uniref:Sodium/hydrogen exchanger n=1 Tax=Pristionchus fissidentatus TaxID=1538716 RepID=A0AAV5WVW5_9BILA|nr:hypothetical protein PFISCL1PPCAC_26126 [Pristionchus fissidentatus]
MLLRPSLLLLLFFLLLHFVIPLEIEETSDHGSKVTNKVDSIDYTDAEFFLEMFADDASPPIPSPPHSDHSTPHGVSLASWKFDYVKEPLILSLFIVLIGLFKLVYHHTHGLQKVVPESCCLILMGVAIGTLFIGNTANVKFLEFNSKTFFFFLLPPIILEAAYSLKERAFIDNFGTILLYAVVGTILNIAMIGGGLIAASALGWMGTFQIDSLDCLLFAALIAAVDPVAVLAIFQEVGVNKMLYFMVFGESLLNDAVTVVCYTLVNEFRELPSISFADVLTGCLSFICVSLGGTLIGLTFGLLSAIITRYTTHVRVVEPVMMFGLAYLSYMCSELFHWSGIIGILVCGLVQAHYACGNISSKSFISVTYCAKVLSSVSESLIFIILGVMLVNENAWFWDDWHPAFTLWALLLCLIVRTIVVFALTYLANRSTGGVRYIAMKEQLIMAFGGLRGAVSFSLAFMISDSVSTKSTLLAATYVVILFTVFVQGCTIKPLVRYLNIKLARKDDKMRLFVEFNAGMISHLSQGIEDLCGYKDKSMLNQCSRFSRAYMRPVLEKNYKKDRRSPEEKLLEMDRAVTISENLRKNSSIKSFKQQQEIERLTEEGSISRDMIEEEERFINKRPSNEVSHEEVEALVQEMTKDSEHIRMLIRNPLDDHYRNRNLVEEDEKEQREAARINHMRMLQIRAEEIGGSETRKRNMFGLHRRGAKKQSMSKGLIQVSMGTLGVRAIKEIPEKVEELERRLSVIDEQSTGGDSEATV